MPHHVPSCHVTVLLDGPERNRATYSCPGCGLIHGVEVEPSPKWHSFPHRITATCARCGTTLHIVLAGYVQNPTGERPALMSDQGRHVVALEHMATLDAPVPEAAAQPSPEAPPLHLPAFSLQKPPAPPPSPLLLGENRAPLVAWRMKGYRVKLPEHVLIEAYRTLYGKEPLAYPLTGQACFSQRELDELHAFCLPASSGVKDWLRSRRGRAKRDDALTYRDWQRAGFILAVGEHEALARYLLTFNREPRRSFWSGLPLYMPEELHEIGALL